MQVVVAGQRPVNAGSPVPARLPTAADRNFPATHGGGTAAGAV
ncbi:hypothetical protein A2U01_0118405, partial [Trifolium medium]|nr:hypothetical protein [Trifolium medium]